MIIGCPYFYTATIKDWKHVIFENEFKKIIINSLAFLTQAKLVEVYAFVIMPNHIHLIWQMMQMNKKETPVASFMKFTSHHFLKRLRSKKQEELKDYEVDWVSRAYNFWQKDSLAIELFSEKVFLQKMNYIHHNPIKEKWRLSKVPEEYKWSSAMFYYTGGKENDFGFLKHYVDRG